MTNTEPRSGYWFTGKPLGYWCCLAAPMMAIGEGVSKRVLLCWGWVQVSTRAAVQAAQARVRFPPARSLHVCVRPRVSARPPVSEIGFW